MDSRKNLVEDFLGILKNKSSEHTTIKFAHEMLVDIFGALIPGILFLFGILCSIGIPLLLLLSLKTKISESSDWTLLIAFLLFLILAYTIGHLLYRKDIKKPDKKDVAREQDKKLHILKNSLRM